MTNAEVYTCAVWFIDDFGRTDYELFESSEVAARSAVAYEYNGTVLGLQNADGSTVAADDWPEFADEMRRWRDAEQGRHENQPPPPRTRPARDPFRGNNVEIEEAEPGRLGQ